jgi:hypothetical protein
MIQNMEPNKTPDKYNDIKGEESIYNKVTPLSKYLAMAIFVALPFIGGGIGYTLAPEKIIEVETNKIENTKAATNVMEQKLVELDNVLLREGVLYYIDYKFWGRDISFDLVDLDDGIICNIGGDYSSYDRNFDSIVWRPDFSKNSECPEGVILTPYRIKMTGDSNVIGYSNVFSVVPNSSFGTKKIRAGYSRYEDPERGYSFTYPSEWYLNNEGVNDYRVQGYIQLLNYDHTSSIGNGHEWPKDASKVEGGKIRQISELNEYKLEDIAGKEVYLLKREGIFTDWDSTSFAIPINADEAIQFSLYGDTNTFSSVLEIFLRDFSFN